MLQRLSITTSSVFLALPFTNSSFCSRELAAQMTTDGHQDGAEGSMGGMAFLWDVMHTLTAPKTSPFLPLPKALNYGASHFYQCQGWSRQRCFARRGVGGSGEPLIDQCRALSLHYMLLLQGLLSGYRDPFYFHSLGLHDLSF